MKTSPSLPRRAKPSKASIPGRPVAAIPGRFQLLIDCRDETEQRKLFEEFAARNYACRVWVI